MSGHKPFRTLSDELLSSPEGRAAVARERRILQGILALNERLEACGATEADLTRAWEHAQEQVSDAEMDDAVYLAALTRYAEALGGHIEVTAVFPDQTVSLSNLVTERSDQRIIA